VNTTYWKLQSSPTGPGLGLALNLATFTASRHVIVLVVLPENEKFRTTLLLKVQLAMQPSQSRGPPLPNTVASFYWSASLSFNTP